MSSTTYTPSLSERFSSLIYEPFLAVGERRGMRDRRRELLAAARGRVLEIGAGTGLNLPLYPGDLDELVLTEPVAGMRARLERRARADGIRARVVAAGAGELPFPDASFDTVVSTMVLCTVPEPEAALAEVRRVLAPGGRLLFIEHVLAETPRLSRWQQRLAAPWAAFADGCRCDRDTLTHVRNAGLRVGDVRRDAWRGMPSIVGPLVVGAAEVAPA